MFEPVIEVVVSVWLPPGSVYLYAPNLTEEQKAKINAEADRLIASGMVPLQARAKALSESGLVAAIHCSPDMAPPEWPL
jgi:hypothetical protein